MKKEILALALVLAAVIALSVTIPGILVAAEDHSQPGFHPTANSEATPTPFQPLLDTGNLPGRPTETLDPVTNCTYTIDYWLQNPAEFPGNILIGAQVYTPDAGMLLLLSENQMAEGVLLRHLFIAYLNIYRGADPSLIEGTLREAEAWLAGSAGPETRSEFQNETAHTLSTALEAFNNGLIGPGLCMNQPPTPLPSSTSTGTVTATATARHRYEDWWSDDDDGGGGGPLPTATRLPSATLRPSATPTRTPTPTLGWTILPTIPTTTKPTATTKPTLTPRPPTQTPAPPTATSVPPTATKPAPTGTSVPPTATKPAPTATSVPPTATNPAPTATSVPPTATNPAPTATPVPPTATEPAPTATPVPPTATEPAPTATPLPPTETPDPPTETPVPPTDPPPEPTITPFKPEAFGVLHGMEKNTPLR